MSEDTPVPQSPLTFLTDCRRLYPSSPGADLLSGVACSQAVDEHGEEYDSNANFRQQVCEQLNADLREADRELIQYLLGQEVRAHAASWGLNENIKLCSYLLYRLGHVEDSLLVWKAKRTNFDTLCGLDVQLLAGAGLERTLAYLKGETSQEAREALEYLGECIESGDFKNLAGWEEFWRHYFRSGD